MERKLFLPSILTSSSERDLFRDLRRRVDRVFLNFSRDLPSMRWSSYGSMGLAVDVVEGDKDIMITADLPGVEERYISVTLSGEVLTIKVEKKVEK